MQVAAWNITIDDLGEEKEVGRGFSKPFDIWFWMPPPEVAFEVSQDRAPEIVDLPDDFYGEAGSFFD